MRLIDTAYMYHNEESVGKRSGIPPPRNRRCGGLFCNGKAVEDGKIRSLGLLNWYVEELEDFLPQINIMPALVQNEITELFDFELTEEEMERIGALDRDEKHDWY